MVSFLHQDCLDLRSQDSQDNVTCRNCDHQGHSSKDCTEPKNWSKVHCPPDRYVCGCLSLFVVAVRSSASTMARQISTKVLPSFHGQLVNTNNTELADPTEDHRAADCTEERVFLCRNCKPAPSSLATLLVPAHAQSPPIHLNYYQIQHPISSSSCLRISCRCAFLMPCVSIEHVSQKPIISAFSIMMIFDKSEPVDMHVISQSLS